MITVYFRFYEELNDFLQPHQRKVTFSRKIAKNTAIKDAIEALGVPHTEVDLILVNGNSITFSYQLQNNDHASVYPVFEAIDISKVIHLRPKPLRKVRFILDVHLGKLARYLRLVGFDTLYNNHFLDKEIIDLAQQDKRIILTRDVGLLKIKQVMHGYWVRHTNPKEQLKEVLLRFDLFEQCRPFTRCLECNGKLISIAKQKVFEKLQPLTRENFQLFSECTSCHKIYWQGSHYQKLNAFLKNLLPFGD